MRRSGRASKKASVGKILAVVLLHRRDWKLLVLHLSIFSMIHPFEVVILATNGYRYMPGIFPTGVDNYLGTYISNFFIIPASAVLIYAYSLSWRYIVGFAAIFTCIDWLFAALGIYQHFWWKSIYTGIGLIIVYAVSGWLWNGLKKRRQVLPFRFLMILLTYFSIESAITFAVNRGGQLFKLLIAYYELSAPGKLQLILASSYHLIVSVIVALFLGIKMPLRYRTLGVGMIIVLNWAIGHFGIFVPQVGITSHHLILVQIVSVAVLIFLFKAAKLNYFFS
ncbi:hypothetical protein L7E55_14675 [Pelotomaculum isophthalicicum JI]|uniref:Uncharacterized protein n=1 Tax=Pelotomaculum isophthalicicum JI TaxID=947010 RepID=A0A9X4JWL0_9FIRM|nr:hypothetical protein [Pelotomaculum isophthalicicum]MDF9409582.1 hypothetical protein [Pelotomaculum isophthalicicum JI]